ncbi:MAG TPA: ribosome small subunit-dependent GTPase A [Verrucomicrobia bacterium]|nr:MAG: ribosome small subunit-dependent GTPase A [Lentisphaerae bacterium GWF2_57_35]HBA83069.1 ribosome small subunit-dependent GTPase A [Verrucomicrobiota bacterium]
MKKLKTWGWNEEWELSFEPYRHEGLAPARVIREDRELYLVQTETGEKTAAVSGRFRYQAASRSDFPSVGDWAAVETDEAAGKATIVALLPRRTAFSRRHPGKNEEEQIVAANVNTIFLVSALDGGRNFNLRRLERYLALARGSGAQPVIVLNKADLSDCVDRYILEAESAAPALPVHPVSALARQGLDALEPYLATGQTVALLGSSGVGKSALINALLGVEQQVTGEIRAQDHRGRHTTTRRELFLIPGGGMVIDTPGLRELGLWGDESELAGAFDDIEELASQCRFRDCRHDGEPDCAVQQALGDGSLDANRFDNYLRMRRELAHLARKTNPAAQRAEKERWKKIACWQKQIQKDR